ncbi:hypothetical protein [Wolbachia endosymbiont (group B) of Germaria angustata]|uniref:hypothetical protein n=1 Tax=Wolbachia endosymbiont (group B) of Germaria angustata TaxID=3077916 RepID=UPI0031330048
MSGKKHVFKIVPGKEVPNNKIKFIKWLDRDNSNASIKKVELVPLDDKNDRVLDSLPIKFCSKNLCREQFLCIEEENEGSLTTKNLKPDSNLDDINNKYTFVYLDDRLVILGMKANPDLFMFTGTLTCTSTIWKKGLQYQYVTWEESDASNNKYYFSDREGSILDSPYNETLQNIMSYYGEKQIIRDIILPNISKSILLSSAFAKVFAEDLTENQLEVFANTLNSDQLQALKA